MTQSAKFWNMLSKPTRKALQRAKVDDPWNKTVKELIQLRGIGPYSVREIAMATEKHCV
jgi:hypothetical protein